jgi:hypothetical protein
MRGAAFGASLDRAIEPIGLLAIVLEGTGQRRLIGTRPHQLRRRWPLDQHRPFRRGSAGRRTESA